MPLLTRRALILLLAGVPLLLLSQFAPAAIFFAFAYIGLVLAALLADYLRAPSRAAFTIERANDPKLSLGADNLIALTLRYRPRNPADLAPVAYQLCDEPPFQFAQHGGAGLEGEVSRRQPASASYYLHPYRRGDYHFGDLNLRWRTPFGLLERQATYAAAAPVKVYPNLLEVRKYEMLARKDQLYEVGLKNVRQLGVGSEFERLREYNNSDDYRRIYWPATARARRPISMDYQVERSQTIFIALDAGRLMTSPTAKLTKLDYAVNASLLLAYIASTKGDRVGLLGFSDQVISYIAAGRGRKHFLTILDSLYNLQAQPTEADYAAALGYFALKNRRRALVVLFTDLIDKDASTVLVNYVSRLAPRHLPLTVTMSNGPVVAAATTPPRSSAAVYEQVAAQKLLQERREVLEVLNQRGVLTLDVPADRLNVSLINKYLELKARNVL